MTSASVWRAAALAAAATLCALGAAQMSVTIDGARRTWLYEDPMVALRYGAHLASGHGLVWNPGERVAGPAGLGWTAVLGLGHALFGLHAPAAIHALNALALLAALLMAERLLLDLQPQARAATLALWLAAVPCFDLVFWAVNGFETTLLTAVWLLAAWRITREAAGPLRPGTVALIALVPLLGADAVVAWLGLAALAMGLGANARRHTSSLALSLLPLAAEVFFRRVYTGQWFPATPIVSVVAVPAGLDLGLRYLGRFLLHYGLPLLAAIAGAAISRDRRRVLLLAAVAIGAGGAVLFPGSALPGIAPLAHLVPVVLALAAAAIGDLARRSRAAGAAAVFALVAPAAVAALRVPPTRLAASEPAGTVTGTLIARHAGADARVGVLAPGSLAYFSQRRCVDLLGGLTPGGIDRRPDIVVVHLPPPEVAARASGRRAGDRMDAVLDSAVFRAEYIAHALPVLDRTTVYFRADSPERLRMGEWRRPVVTP